jgi:ABC-type Fe3+/spermidine/putrescine transport system ATPase subunit
VEVVDVVKRFGNFAALDGVTITFNEGELFGLLGPSGSGKTTLLRMIAGFFRPDRGTIRIHGEDIAGIPVHRRDIGMVFQNYALFPHLSVYDNIAFGMTVRRLAAREIRRRVDEMLALVRLDGLETRKPAQLSGGQQQRVALARALVHEPRLLLLDEPLSNLDARLRDTMRVELRQLVKSLGITTIFVTHDQVEAMAMSDEILLMRAGRVVQQGPPRQIFLRPASVFAADFMGRSNVFPGRIVARTPDGDGMVATAIGTLLCPIPADAAAEVCLVIRPHSVRAADAAATENVLAGTITQLQFIGDAVEADVTVAGTVVRAMLDPYQPWSLGQALRIALPRERCVVVAAASGAQDAAPVVAAPRAAPARNAQTAPARVVA